MLNTANRILSLFAAYAKVANNVAPWTAPAPDGPTFDPRRLSKPLNEYLATRRVLQDTDILMGTHNPDPLQDCAICADTGRAALDDGNLRLISGPCRIESCVTCAACPLQKHKGR